jgi:antitoxin (DNA-binding transcriptional repressor) of toxin-antitoxin stability system
MTMGEFTADPARAIAMLKAGEKIELTEQGKVVAEVHPPSSPRGATPYPKGSPEWQAAYDRVVERLREGLDLGIGKITEEDKYGDAVL